MDPSQSFDEGVLRHGSSQSRNMCPNHVWSSILPDNLVPIRRKLVPRRQRVPKRRKWEKGRPITRLLGLYVWCEPGLRLHRRAKSQTKEKGGNRMTIGPTTGANKAKSGKPANPSRWKHVSVTGPWSNPKTSCEFAAGDAYCLVQATPAVCTACAKKWTLSARK